MRGVSLVTMTFMIAAAFGAAASDAGAQPAAPARGPIAVPQSDAEEADVRFRRGNELYKQRRYAEAEVEYEAAFRLKQAHDVAANLGYAEMKQGKFREAAEHLSFAVKHWAPTGKEDKKGYAEERLATVKKEVATLQIEVSVAGAEILVDGVKVGMSPSPLWGGEVVEVFVEPGTRTIEARRERYRDGKQVVQAAKGGEVKVTLLMPEAPLTGPMGSDGTEGGAQSPGGPRVGGDGGSPSIGEGRGGGPRAEVLIAGGATAGAALVAGVIFAVVANGKGSDAEEQRDALEKAGGPAACASMTAACNDLRSTLDGKDTFSSAAFWSFVGAGVAGAATGIYAAVTSKRADASSARAVPMVTAHGGGIVVRGAW